MAEECSAELRLEHLAVHSVACTLTHRPLLLPVVAVHNMGAPDLQMAYTLAVVRHHLQACGAQAHTYARTPWVPTTRTFIEGKKPFESTELRQSPSILCFREGQPKFSHGSTAAKHSATFCTPSLSLSRSAHPAAFKRVQSPSSPPKHTIEAKQGLSVGVCKQETGTVICMLM